MNKMESTTSAVKKNLSSIQVLKTLQLLLEDNYSMSELVQQLNANESESVFNNSVVSKYINTCRYCGIDIPKIQNQYYVTKLPFGMNLTPRDIELINILQNYANLNMTKRAQNAFERFLERINRYTNKHIIRVKPDNNNKIQNLIREAVQNQFKIRLMIRAQQCCTCIPVEIIKRKNKKYIRIIYDNKEKLVCFSRIIGIEITNEKFYFAKENKTPIVFKIKGDLVSRYQKREEETIIDKRFSNSMTLSNLGEQKDTLLSRLLRYDSLCEVINPADCRTEMKKIINDTLANYGE